MKRARAALLGALALALGCGKPPFPREGVTLGGRHVAYTVLRAGHNAYGMYCIGCHGEAGDGRGLVGVGLRPAPRDLRVGTIRYAWVASGRLPRDEDLARAIRHGLRGTPMPAWDLTDDEVDALVQYIKLFAPRWRHEAAGETVVPSPDPWVGRESAARDRGARVYHGRAQCWTCHPAYEAREAMQRDLESFGGTRPPIRSDVHTAAALTGDDGTRELAPDFLGDPLEAGDSPRDVYRDLSCGVGGSPMPAYRGALTEADLWAMAHYVHALAQLHDTDEGDALSASLHVER